MNEEKIKVFKRFDERLTKLEEGQALLFRVLIEDADNIKNTKFTCVYCGKKFKDIIRHYKEVHKTEEKEADEAIKEAKGAMEDLKRAFFCRK